MNTEVWLKINLRDVSEYCEISNFGNFRYNIFNDTSNEKPYISSNGLYYQIIVFNDLKKNISQYVDNKIQHWYNKI